MPSFITHYYFGVQNYHHLVNDNLKRAIFENQIPYMIGLQGPDIFFYNAPLLGFKDYRNIGTYMHEHRTGRFLRQCMIVSEKQTERIYRDLMSAYMAGFICHYFLDSNTHPFIYAMIGHVEGLHDRREIGRHFDIESSIDTLFFKDAKKKKKNSGKTMMFLDIQNHSLEFPHGKKMKLCEMVSEAISKTYSDLSGDKSFFVTPMFMRYIFKEYNIMTHFFFDPRGNKERIANWLEKRTIGFRLISDKFITEDAKTHWDDPLNLRHKEWINPWNEENVQNNSFIELYEKSMIETLKVMRYLNNRNVLLPETDPVRWKEFERILGNRSYHTGLFLEE